MVTVATKPGLAENDIRNQYFIVSADCHVVEPADLWEKRIDEKFRHRLPRQEVDRNGVKWLVREGHRPSRIADLKLEGEDLERVQAGKKDPETRLKDHARDGIDAEIIYPTMGLMIWASNDAEFQQAMCRVYNDWAIETFSDHRNIMVPSATIAPMDVEGAVAEIHRVAKLGYRHVLFPVQPIQTGHQDVTRGRAIGYNLPMFDPIWAAMQDEGLPVSFHVGTGRDPRTSGGNGGAIINYVWNALSPAIEPTVQLCASGVLERFPRLQFATVEAGCGWLAWALWAADEAAHKHHMWVSPKLELLPSEYFKRQGHASFQDDPMGIETRDWFGGTSRLLWGNDYPHHEGTWPHSDEAIERTMGHLTHEDRRAILGENAARLYRIEVPEKYRQ